MGKDILNNISSCLLQSNFATLMIDQTTDVTNSSHEVVVLRYVTDAFNVFENIYKVLLNDAGTQCWGYYFYKVIYYILLVTF